jgi:hypothetical protein
MESVRGGVVDLDGLVTAPDAMEGRQAPAGARGANDPSAIDRRVRFTLDLARSQHRFLKQFALDAEADASVILRVLLALLEEDELLTKRVLARISKVERDGRLQRPESTP